MMETILSYVIFYSALVVFGAVIVGGLRVLTSEKCCFGMK